MPRFLEPHPQASPRAGGASDEEEVALTAMPSFDAVSELNAHEVANAVDQANRELSQRFDFKDTGARFELEGIHS